MNLSAFFGSALKGALKWLISKQIYILGGLFAICALWLYLAGLQLKKDIATLKNENLNLQITQLKEVNAQNLKSIQELKKTIIQNQQAVAKIHKQKTKRKVRYAKQKEKNIKHSDGNISPILRDTFNFLHQQTSTNNN